MPIVPYVVDNTGREERVYDIYSRLLKDRIIFLGQQVTADLANSLVAQMLFLQSEDPKKTFTCTSIRLVEALLLAWRFTTRCSSLAVTWQRTAWARQLRWVRCC